MYVLTNLLASLACNEPFQFFMIDPEKKAFFRNLMPLSFRKAAPIMQEHPTSTLSLPFLKSLAINVNKPSRLICQSVEKYFAF